MAYPRKQAAPKTKLFHSMIASAPDGMKVRFMSDTKDSKFPDSAGYVFVEMEDGSEAMFALENDDIRGLVDQTPQKRWVVLKGSGKGEGAWMTVDGVDTPAHARPQSGPPPMDGGPEPDSEWDGMVDEVSRLTTRVVVNLRKSSILIEGDAIARVFNTLFIALDRRS